MKVGNLCKIQPKVHPTKIEENLASGFGKDVEDIFNEHCYWANEEGQIA